MAREGAMQEYWQRSIRGTCALICTNESNVGNIRFGFVQLTANKTTGKQQCVCERCPMAEDFITYVKQTHRMNMVNQGVE